MENNCKALIPISPIIDAKPRKKANVLEKRITVLLSVYFLAFFLGCLFFFSKRLNSGKAEALLESILDFTSFFEYCRYNFAFVFGLFFLYASGLTVYALPVGVLFLSFVSFFGGLFGSAVIQNGITADGILFLALWGLISFLVGCFTLISCAVGDAVTYGGIKALEISDGAVFSLFHIAFQLVFWGIFTLLRL